MANLQIKITVSEEVLNRLTHEGLGKPSLGVAIWARRIEQMEANTPPPVKTPSIDNPVALTYTATCATPVTSTPTILNASEWE